MRGEHMRNGSIKLEFPDETKWLVSGCHFKDISTGGQPEDDAADGS